MIAQRQALCMIRSINYVTPQKNLHFLLIQFLFILLIAKSFALNWDIFAALANKKMLLHYSLDLIQTFNLVV